MNKIIIAAEAAAQPIQVTGPLVAVFAFGVVFVAVLLLIAIKIPRPTPFQYTVFRIVLALAAAGVAAFIPGLIGVEMSSAIKAGGAMAVFVIVYFYSPAAMPDAAAWIALTADWKAPRAFNLPPTEPNMDYVVTALNTVNRAGEAIASRPDMFEDFRRLHGTDFCKLYKLLRDGDVPIPHEKSSTKLLLTQAATSLATKLSCI